jgi:hypothetical protein
VGAAAVVGVHEETGGAVAVRGAVGATGDDERGGGGAVGAAGSGSTTGDRSDADGDRT